MQRPVNDATSVDWLGAAFRFLFGAVVGAVLSGAVWWWWLSNLAQGWIVIIICAAVFGTLSAIWGDEFWESEWNPIRWIHWL